MTPAPDAAGAPARREAAYAVLRRVMDPEVPALSVVDLGIVRDVEVAGDRVTVVVTPTYSGCPAMQVIEREIVDALTEAGLGEVTVRTVYWPAWTTEWISEEARERLRAYGIAPPGRVREETTETLVTITAREAPHVPCPFCGSADTAMRSEFGSTACKAIHFCDACRQPFEEFKAI